MTTLKALLALAGLWLLAGFGWALATGIGAAVTEHDRGAAVTAAMFASWGTAVGFALVTSAVAQRLLWRWLPQGGARLAILLAFTALSGLSALSECFLVLVIFNR